MKPSMDERDARERTCGVEDRGGEGAICHSFCCHTFSVPPGPVCGGHLFDAHLKKEHGPEATLSECVICLFSASMYAMAMAEHGLPIYDVSLPASHSARVDNRYLT